MNEYFFKPRLFGRNEKIEWNLSNYARKADLKNATSFQTSKFSEKVDLTGWKSKIDKLDIDKLEITPVDLNKLSDIVKNEVVKNTVYDELVKKINAIQTTNTNNLV